MRFRPPFKPPPKVWPGLTLIELLVVLVLMVIVTAAAFTMFQVGARHEARQQDVLNQTQNLRTALYTIARDVRMAGNGFNFIGGNRLDIYVREDFKDDNTQDGEGWGWFRYRDAERYGARAIYGTNGGASADPDGPPDTLTVFRAELENPLALGRLSAGFTPGADSLLSLRDEVTEGETIANGDILAVAAGNRAVVIEARLGAGATTSDLALGPRFNPGSDPLPDGGFTFPEGSPVYNLRDVVFVTYYIDRGPGRNRLMANYHDEVNTGDDWAETPHLATVAGNIEDLQVAYFLTKPGEERDDIDVDGFIEGLDPDLSEAKLDSDGGRYVRLVSLALTSRSSRTRGGGAGPAAADQFTRQVLTDNISLRNFNFF